MYLIFHRIEISILHVDETGGQKMIELLAHFCFEWIKQVQFTDDTLVISQLTYEGISLKYILP